MKILKLTKTRAIITAVLTIIIEIKIYWWTLTHTAVCMALGCPTVREVALNTVLITLAPVLIISYILSYLIAPIFERKKKK